MLVAAPLVSLPAHPTDSPYLTVQPESVSTPVEAYAQVRPISVVPVKAPAAGVVADLAKLPGARVAAGEPIAKLTGPEVDLAVARSEAMVRSATAKRGAAEKTLHVVRSELGAHLSTVEQVAQAEADLADATGALATAEAELRTARQTATIPSPVSGTIVSLDAATGERVMAGDPVLTLQPDDQLWATATLYGNDAGTVHPGQRGSFEPAAGGASIPVEVASTAPPEGGSGDVTVRLRAVPPNPAWRSGEYGRVVLPRPAAPLIAIPTQALILDQGKWWVLVHGAKGDQPVEVIPGPSRGWETFLESGLAAGTAIVVQNAYLEFHRRIAGRYQPPD